MRNSSRDTGALYIGTFSQDLDEEISNTENVVEVRNNIIYNLLGRGDTRGIFIDNGRGDVRCYGNIVLFGQTYSIDARNYSPNLGSTCRVVYQNNILGSKYRLEYNHDNIVGDNIPEAIANVLLY